MGLSWSPPPVNARPLPGTPRPKAAKASLPRINIEDVAQRVRAEYLEMPGLNLTRDQARCLWGLEGEVCDSLLTHLLETGFLRRTTQGTFVRAEG